MYYINKHLSESEKLEIIKSAKEYLNNNFVYSFKMQPSIIVVLRQLVKYAEERFLESNRPILKSAPAEDRYQAYNDIWELANQYSNNQDEFLARTLALINNHKTENVLTSSLFDKVRTSVVYEMAKIDKKRKALVQFISLIIGILAMIDYCITFNLVWLVVILCMGFTYVKASHIMKHHPAIYFLFWPLVQLIEKI
jgi:hypothetical protein